MKTVSWTCKKNIELYQNKSEQAAELIPAVQVSVELMEEYAQNLEELLNQNIHLSHEPLSSGGYQRNNLKSRLLWQD